MIKSVFQITLCFCRKLICFIYTHTFISIYIYVHKNIFIDKYIHKYIYIKRHGDGKCLLFYRNIIFFNVAIITPGIKILSDEHIYIYLFINIIFL